MESFPVDPNDRTWLKVSACVAMGTAWIHERCTKPVQVNYTTSTHLSLPERMISMATWNTTP